MQYPPYDPNFVYDPDHPMNIEDRANDPDDGIDYDEIILATEPDMRARRGQVFTTSEEISAWINEICQDVLQRRVNHLVRGRAAS